MYWNDPRVEVISALCDQIKAHPSSPNLTLETDEAKWGELRSWSTHTFTGAERWELWEPLFHGWSAPDVEQAAIDYLARAWQAAEPGLDGLLHEFKYRVLKVFIGQLRAQVDLDDCLLPAVSVDEVEAWEAARGVELPHSLRRVLTELSAGYDLKEEQVLFDFRDEAFFALHRVHMEEGHMDEQPWYHESLLYALSCFELAPTAGPIKPLQVLEEPVPAEHISQVADSMVLVEAYFEGNHGDHALYLITQGALAGRLLLINDMYHAAEDGEGCTFALGSHVADWLLDEWFFEHVLGEDLW